MSVIPAKYNQTDKVVIVTWANMSSADTAAPHLVKSKPAIVVVQAEGLFAGGTKVAIQGSLSNVSFVTSSDMTLTPIAITANAIVSVLDSCLYYKPTVTSGTGDNVTISLCYWNS